MRLNPCPTAALRLCASCGRNPDNQPAHLRAAQLVPIHPSTTGERCHDWQPAPQKPTAAKPTA
jgi:hypothetical protein